MSPRADDAERMAAKLRENLARRKAQSRARRDPPGQDARDPASPASPASSASNSAPQSGKDRKPS